MKQKKFPVVALTIIAIGFVLFMTGLIIAYVNGIDLRNPELETIEESFDGEEVKNLELDLGVGEFTIKSGDTNKIRVVGTNVPKNSFKLECSNGEFVFLFNSEKWYKNINFFRRNDFKDTEFEIVVPDKKYYNINLDCGVGKVTVSGLTAENFDLDSGVGEVKLSKVTAEQFDLDGGVGTIDMTDFNVGETVIDAGVGEVRFQGRLNGDMDIDVGVGKATFDIDGYEDDYKINKDGNVKIESDGSHYERKGKYKIDIDTGIGEVTLKFSNYSEIPEFINDKIIEQSDRRYSHE